MAPSSPNEDSFSTRGSEPNDIALSHRMRTKQALKGFVDVGEQVYLSHQEEIFDILQSSGGSAQVSLGPGKLTGVRTRFVFISLLAGPQSRSEGMFDVVSQIALNGPWKEEATAKLAELGYDVCEGPKHFEIEVLGKERSFDKETPGKFWRDRREGEEGAEIDYDGFLGSKDFCAQLCSEDLARRGLSWCDWNYPEWLTNKKIDQEEIYRELASMTEHQKERILSHSGQLARGDCFYDSGSIYNSGSVGDPGSGLFYPPDSFYMGWRMGVTSKANIIENTAYHQHAVMPSKPAHNGHEPGDIHMISANAEKNTLLSDPRKALWLLLRSLLSTFGNGKHTIHVSKSGSSGLPLSLMTR